MASRVGLLAALLSLAGACSLDPDGRCELRSDCSSGLDCIQGVCTSCRGDFDCSSWEFCGGDGLCAQLPGRCDADADCASWDECDAGHACVLRADHCPSFACPSLLERCDPEHHCTLQPGRCNAAADCPAWMGTCSSATDLPPNTCLFSATVGDDVLAWGTLADGTDDGIAVARLTAPAKVEVGFDAGSAVDAVGFIDPLTGELVYRHVGDAGGDTLRRFNRDAVERDPVAALWRYPAVPSADDERAIEATTCPDNWNAWLMQGGTGALLYGCPTAGGALRNFFDDAGAAVPGLQGIQAALAWTANGFLLVRGASGAYQVIAPAGTATAISAVPAGTHLAYRTYATGFRVALAKSSGGADELWAIDEVSAVGAQVGTYAAVPGGYAPPSWEALDSAGNLYGRTSLGNPDVVLKRPLSPGTTVELYSEAGAPPGANDFSAAAFSPYLLLDRSFLFTRP